MGILVQRNFPFVNGISYILLRRRRKERFYPIELDLKDKVLVSHNTSRDCQPSNFKGLKSANFKRSRKVLGMYPGLIVRRYFDFKGKGGVVH